MNIGGYRLGRSKTQQRKLWHEVGRLRGLCEDDLCPF